MKESKNECINYLVYWVKKQKITTVYLRQTVFGRAFMVWKYFCTFYT